MRSPRLRGSTAAILAAALLTLVVAGCGADDEPTVADPAFETIAVEPTPAEPDEQPPPPETTTASIDACALVKQTEAERLAGTALDKPAPGQESCTWTGPSDGPLGQVEIYIGPGAQKFLEIDQSLNHEFEKLTDLGDEALLEEGTLFVRVDQTWLALRVVRLDEFSVYRADLISIAGQVVGRL